MRITSKEYNIKISSTKRKNKKPEKVLEKQVIAWAPLKHWDLTVVEAKSVFNPRLGMYLRSQVEPGYSDISGNDNEGMAVYIELKSKGKRSTLSDTQRAFLTRKIFTNAFAVCVDSLDMLEENYKLWRKFTTFDQNYLHLAVKKINIK